MEQTETNLLRTKIGYMKKDIYHNLEEKRRFISNKLADQQDPKFISRLKSETQHIEAVESIMFMYESLIDQLHKELGIYRQRYMAYFSMNCKLMDGFEKDIKQQIEESKNRLSLKDPECTV